MFDLAKGNKTNKKLKITKEGTLALSAAESIDTKEGFQQALLEAFIKNSLPFNVVDNEYFRKPFFLISKDIDLFSASTLKRKLISLYTSMKSSKKEEFADITDCYASPNNTSFMGISAHWIDSNFKLCESTLDIAKLSVKHTGENLYSKFKEILTEFGIQKKVMAITLDNASNNNIMMRAAENDGSNTFSTFAHIRCFVHVVNLGAHDALAVMVRNIRASPQNSNEFKRMVVFKNISEVSMDDELDKSDQTSYKAILDVVTRWNSTYHMLLRACKLRSAITLYARSEALTLDDNCWDRFKTIVQFLKKFSYVSAYMCSDSYPTLSMAVPHYNNLLKHIEEYGKNSQPSPYATTVDKLHDACVAAYGKIVQYYIVTSDCYTIATVLDPRLKLNYYEATERDDIFDAVDLVFRRDYETIVNLDDVEELDLDDDEDIVVHHDINPEGQSELQRYCRNSEHCMPGKFSKSTSKDVLYWWKVHEEIYPDLSRMARDYLGIPATSASSELLFSSGSNPDKRNNLNEDTIQAHECLKSWIKCSKYKNVKENQRNLDFDSSTLTI